jgi:hypothetical protein
MEGLLKALVRVHNAILALGINMEIMWRLVLEDLVESSTTKAQLSIVGGKIDMESCNSSTTKTINVHIYAQKPILRVSIYFHSFYCISFYCHVTESAISLEFLRGRNFQIVSCREK